MLSWAWDNWEEWLRNHGRTIRKMGERDCGGGRVNRRFRVSWESHSRKRASIKWGDLVDPWEGKQSLKPSNSLLEGSFQGMTIVSFLSLISTLIYSHFQLFFWALISWLVWTSRATCLLCWIYSLYACSVLVLFWCFWFLL